MTSRQRVELIHLAGYTTLAVVLASASWVSLWGRLAAVPLVAVTLYSAAEVLTSHMVERARETAPDGPVAADGGEER